MMRPQEHFENQKDLLRCVFAILDRVSNLSSKETKMVMATLYSHRKSLELLSERYDFILTTLNRFGEEF